MLLGFDPGRDKCGIAVMTGNQKILYQAVVDSDAAIATVTNLVQKYAIALIIIGDQTTSQVWKSQLKALLSKINLEINIVSIDERFSSQEARQRYWQIYPPQGLVKLMPLGLRSPPRPIDDIVAIILIERYISTAKLS
jgi:RNase H-fold protein (predicted Holliday junction resolvase)